MIIINTESDLYSSVADILAGIAGFGASIIIGSICKSTISSQSSKMLRNTMSLGKVGLETIGMYEVSSKMRDEIDNFAEMYNELAGAINEYQKAKAAEVTIEVEAE